MKPMVYLAGPFFNPAQTELIADLEITLESRDFPYYSPRIHSGSHLLSEDARRDPAAWQPVFQKNYEALLTCGVLLAVTQYAMPRDHKLAICKQEGMGFADAPYHLLPIKTGLEIPDSGTVWEIGAVYMLNMMRQSVMTEDPRGLNPVWVLNQPPTTVVGYHGGPPSNSVNLMLNKSLDHFLVGHEALSDFLDSWTNGVFAHLPKAVPGEIE